MKQYIVIGAGRFGKSVAKTLMESGEEVMVVDGDEEVIQQLSETMDNVAIANVTDESALRSIGIGNFDVAIIAIGTDLRASIMATLIAKDLGVPYVISKAKDVLQANVLTKIGADRVVFPEHDMGVKVAKSLMYNNIVDFMQLDDRNSIFEITVPKDWVGKNLLDLSVRKKYAINVVGVKGKEGFQVPADPNKKFEEGDIIVIAGNSKLIEKIALLSNSNESKKF